MPQQELNFYTTIKFLKKYLKGNYMKFFSFYLGWFTQSAITIITPIVFGVMIDQIVYYSNITSFVSLGVIFVIITVFGCILYYFIYEIYANILVTFTSAIKKDVFEHMMNAESKIMSYAKTGELINIIQTYPNDCMDFVVRNLIHNLNGILLIILSAYYILKINVIVGLFILICIPVGTLVNLVFGKKIRYYGSQRRSESDSFISWVLEMITGARDIRLLGSKNYVTGCFVKRQRNIYNLNNKSKFFIATANNVIDGINLCIQLSIYFVMAILMSKTDLSIGNILIILAYFTILTREMKGICVKYMDAQTRIACIQRIKDFLSVDLENDREGDKTLNITNGSIEFKNVSFSYNDEDWILDHLYLTVNAGERLAIVGKSGCGKSTLANLMTGYYVPQQGIISIQGHDLMDYTLFSIRKEIGYVQQGMFVIDGTIRENLLLGSKVANDDEIYQACNQAGLESLMKKLPDGIDTVIGNNGINLSGGEKQRISIARTYLRNPKILIFDEATSALDSETELKIHNEWDIVLKDRTSIIIAHRQSSVLLCDRVALIENGKVAVTGTPEEIVKTDNFKKLFALKGDA